jgi:hypothetical protein
MLGATFGMMINDTRRRRRRRRRVILWASDQFSTCNSLDPGGILKSSVPRKLQI